MSAARADAVAARPERVEEIRAGLAAVEERITAACAAAGRAREEVTLIVVTKTFPASDIRILAGLGVRDVGENKVQEAHAKAEAAAYDGLRLHLIGQLQSNKAAEAARLADTVHSLDRPKLVAALAHGRERAGLAEPLRVLIQISLDGDPERGGAPRDTIPALAEAVLAQPLLRLGGVMAVPPLAADPAAAFADLAGLAAAVRRSAPEADWISAGMSADLEAAVAAGATHLRVGTAILGSRASLR
ncbi:YggS family pyridoxal phosphate-dependent enzyme [Nostocoides australiense]